MFHKYYKIISKRQSIIFYSLDKYSVYLHLRAELSGTYGPSCPLRAELSTGRVVRLPPHRVWALWWQGGKRCLRTSRFPCRGRLGMLKTPSCSWRGCPAAGQNLETHMTSVPSLYSWNIAECDVLKKSIESEIARSPPPPPPPPFLFIALGYLGNAKNLFISLSKQIVLFAKIRKVWHSYFQDQ